MPPIPDLALALGRLVGQVPAGCVTTPGILAAALGNPLAARWIGHFLLHHDHKADCPCHRVVRAGGLLGRHPEGSEAKALRLQAEGVEIVNGCLDLDRYAFSDLESDRPLEKLSRFQARLAKQVTSRSRRKVPKAVGGVDVSYASPTEGLAAYALVEVSTGDVLWSTVIRRPVRFPYITSYLTFRELPLLLDLIEEVRKQDRLAPVVLVDGTGILHPRQAGIASHLGVVAGLPTIGVTKKLLCGQVDIQGMQPLESRPVVFDDQLQGAAIRPTAGSCRPLFISPGSGLDLASAEQIVRAVLTGRRLPSPLYWADRLSRKYALNVRQNVYNSGVDENR
jgi:deoxyribonuclease V